MSETTTILSTEPGVPSGPAGAENGPPQKATTEPAASGWRDALPDDLKGDPSLKDFKDIAGLAKTYVETKKMVGNSIRIPKSDAPEADWERDVFSKLRPAKPEDYVFAKPESGNGWDEELEKGFRATAHQLGLPVQTASGLMKWLQAEQESKVSAFTADMEKGLAELKTEWAGDFTKRAGQAAAAVKRLGGGPLIELLESTGLGNHPALIKAFATAGAAFEPDHLPRGHGSSASSGAESAKQKIAAIRADKSHPHNNPEATPKQRQQAVEEMRVLYQTAYTEEG